MTQLPRKLRNDTGTAWNDVREPPFLATMDVKFGIDCFELYVPPTVALTLML